MSRSVQHLAVVPDEQDTVTISKSYLIGVFFSGLIE